MKAAVTFLMSLALFAFGYYAGSRALMISAVALFVVVEAYIVERGK